MNTQIGTFATEGSHIVECENTNCVKAAEVSMILLEKSLSKAFAIHIHLS